MLKEHTDFCLFLLNGVGKCAEIMFVACLRYKSVQYTCQTRTEQMCLFWGFWGFFLHAFVLTLVR